MKKLFVLVTVLALVAAACGDSDTADTTTTTAAPTTTTTVAPTTTTTVAPTTTTTTAEPEGMDLVATAKAAGNFTTLLAAVEAAGLSAALASGSVGPITVFAPTDEAFAALPAGTLEGLLADTTALTGILTYHVTLGLIPSADVAALTSITTLEGEDISIEVVDGTVVLNGIANIISADIETTTGTIHVIDAVLIPPSVTG